MNLLYENISLLEKVLILFNNNLDKVVFCTSYDTLYRFKSENQKNIWEKNILYIKEKYPELEIHVLSILTEDFLQKVLNNEFDIIEFEKKYKTKLDFTEPCDFDNSNKELYNFFPKRSTFLLFLNKLLSENIVSRNNLLHPINTGTIIKIDNENKVVSKIKNYNKKDFFNYNKLQPNYGYIDSDKNMRDDIDNFLKLAF